MTSRKTATIVGLLFLTQTIAFIIAEQLITKVLKRPDYLTGVSGDANALAAGGLFAVVSGVAVVGIAVLLFPLLKPTSEPLALGYVVERVVELVLQVLFFLVVPLLMIAIGNGLRDGSVDASTSQSLGSLLKELHDVAIVVLYLVTSVGGTILAILLYRSQLVPRWIAVLGLIGYPVLLAGCVLDMFDVTDVTKGAGLLAIAPGGLFELILPIWLLAKGFNSSGRALPGKDAPQIVGKR
jgi:succinate dehydrogenase hydrophobic anchor subunit